MEKRKKKMMIRDVKKGQAETGKDNHGLSVFQSGSGCLRAVRGTGSLSTEKRERRRIRELEKAASNSQSIENMFETKQLRTSQNLISKDKSTLFQLLEKKNREEVSENTETIKTRAVQDLFEQMHLKTEQLKKYEAVLIPQSNLYMRHQMVQSFL